MSTIQNLKNFIRHGKQARDARSPPDTATTHVSNVHAQNRGFNYGGVQQQHDNYGISDPNVYDHKPLQAAAPQQDFSAAAVDNRHVAAKAGHAAAQAVDDKQKRDKREKDYDPSVLERIVAEERESKGKLPRYPGLERWTLVEKMGDGAFSNVYRARDNNGQWGEVAIKVVRKFEMNSTQVSLAIARLSYLLLVTLLPTVLACLLACILVLQYLYLSASSFWTKVQMPTRCP
jgi:serine/threonine-protein kinase RCK2